jgi:preprotein translocase SecE subunit
VPFTGKVTVKDPGDFAKQLDDQVTEELVTDRGDSNLVTGRMVPKDKYKAEVEQTRSAGKTPPQGMPVMDRFAFHQFQQNATQNYVKITNLGDLPANKYAEGDVIAKPEFETEREKLVKLKDQGKEPPEATAPAVPTGPAEYATLTLLPNVKYTLPILLVFASIWLAYRVVNLPVFADFLIATEAELNKVSWTSRSRLFQDTLVVLTTVLLMTIGLLVVDLVWTRVLSWRVVGVLQLDRAAGGPGSTGDREKPW